MAGVVAPITVVRSRRRLVARSASSLFAPLSFALAMQASGVGATELRVRRAGRSSDTQRVVREVPLERARGLRSGVALIATYGVGAAARVGFQAHPRLGVYGEGGAVLFPAAADESGATSSGAVYALCVVQWNFAREWVVAAGGGAGRGPAVLRGVRVSPNGTSQGLTDGVFTVRFGFEAPLATRSRRSLGAISVAAVVNLWLRPGLSGTPVVVPFPMLQVGWETW